MRGEEGRGHHVHTQTHTHIHTHTHTHTQAAKCDTPRRPESNFKYSIIHWKYTDFYWSLTRPSCPKIKPKSEKRGLKKSRASPTFAAKKKKVSWTLVDMPNVIKAQRLLGAMAVSPSKYQWLKCFHRTLGLSLKVTMSHKFSRFD